MTTFPFEAQYKIGTETTWNRIDDEGVIVFDDVADTCVSHRATLRLEVKKACTFGKHKFEEADLFVEFNPGEEPVREKFRVGETAEFEISFRDKNASTISELEIYIKDNPRPFTCKLKRDLKSNQVDRAQSSIHALHQHFRTRRKKGAINTVEVISKARDIASSGKKFDPRDIDAVCDLVLEKLRGEEAFNNPDHEEATSRITEKFAEDFKKRLLAPETSSSFIDYWKKARRNALRDIWRERRKFEEYVEGVHGKIFNDEADKFVDDADNKKRPSVCGLLLNAFKGLDDRDKRVLRLRYMNKLMGKKLAKAIHEEERKHNPHANLANAWVVRAVNNLAQDLEVIFWVDCALYIKDFTKKTLKKISDQVLVLGGTDKSFEVRRKMVITMLTEAEWELNVPRWPPHHLTAS